MLCHAYVHMHAVTTFLQEEDLVAAKRAAELARFDFVCYLNQVCVCAQQQQQQLPLLLTDAMARSHTHDVGSRCGRGGGRLR
jgi:hypothetical protein